jgi:hypothetical protein
VCLRDSLRSAFPFSTRSMIAANMTITANI